MHDAEPLVIPTFTSGNVVFSSRFDAAAIDPLVDKAWAAYEAFADIPLIPGWAAQIDETLVRRSIFGTAAIEGNPRSEKEVEDILADRRRLMTSERADTEIRNLQDAYAILAEGGAKAQAAQPLVTEELIRRLHKDITKGLSDKGNEPGSHRNHRVEVGDKAHGGHFTPPKCLPDIQQLMAALCEWINGEAMRQAHPFVRAGLLHFHLATIHPFADGNGRTTRLVEAWLLTRAGVKFLPKALSNYYYRRIDDYYSAFRVCQVNKRHDRTAFLAFVLQGALESSREIKSQVVAMMRQFLAKDYYLFLRRERTINDRQYELLLLMIELDRTITLHSLLAETPFKALFAQRTKHTARRDLKKLVELGVLAERDGAFRLDFGFLR